MARASAQPARAKVEKRGRGKPQKTLQSPDRLCKAPIDCTKFRKIIQKPRKIIQRHKISNKTKNIRHEPKIFNKSNNKY